MAELGLRWYLFGGQAAIMHGSTRFTEDVDVTVLLGSLPSQELVNALSSSGYVLRDEDNEEFVEKTRVVPQTNEWTNITVDVVLGAPAIEELFADRAELTSIGDVSIPLASLEDLITMKVLAGRTKDLEDVVSLIAIGSPRLDLSAARDTLILVEEALDHRDLLSQLDACVERAQRGK
jgi:hypothetical protein